MSWVCFKVRRDSNKITLTAQNILKDTWRHYSNKVNTGSDIDAVPIFHFETVTQFFRGSSLCLMVNLCACFHLCSQDVGSDQKNKLVEIKLPSK